MKTTIKLTTARKLTVQPCIPGGVTVELCHGEGYTSTETLHLSADQCGALIFGIEQALEAENLRAHYVEKYQEKAAA